MTHVSCDKKLRSFVRSSVHPIAQEIGGQSGMWLCIMPGLPMHLKQELNVGTIESRVKIPIVTFSSLFLHQVVLP